MLKEQFPQIIKAIAFISLCISGYGFYLFGRSYLSQDWPTTEGIIIKSDIVYSTKDTSSATLELEYTYQVKQIAYSNNREKFGASNQYSGLKFIKERQANLPLNSPVKVYYNIDDPSDSVLAPEENDYAYLFVFLGIGMMIDGSLYFWIKVKLFSD